MRILYWYTRFLSKGDENSDYHGNKDFELNFSTDSRYYYDRAKHSISREYLSSPLPNGFWGNGIYNISVLTGNNGAGKSTIISIIMDTLYALYQQDLPLVFPFPNDETAIILEADGERYLLHLPSESGVEQIVCCDSTLHYCRPEDETFKKHLLKAISNTKLIYVTNTISEGDDKRVRAYNYNNHIRYHFLYDCSTCGVMRFNESDDCNSRETNDLLMTCFTNEIYKQVKFVCGKQGGILEKLKKDGYPAPLPKTLSITIHSFRFLCEKTGPATFVNAIGRAASDDFLVQRLCLSCFDSFIGNLEAMNVAFEQPSDWWTLVPSSPEYAKWEEAFSRLLRDSAPKEAYVLCLHCLEFIKFLCDDARALSKRLQLQENHRSISDDFPVTLIIHLTEDHLFWLSEFIGKYRRTCSPHYFLDFSWGLSSGENNILRLFSSLFYVFGYKYYDEYHNGQDAICNMHPRRDEPTICDTILLFLDEADLTYHPEWQRQFISLLNAFLPELFNSDCDITDIQLLLTTHSPLLLGDMPKSCVTYLGDGKATSQIETFGQNIHQILKDSFFLSNGTIGALAVRKINETAATLASMIDRLNKEIVSHDNHESNTDHTDDRAELESCYMLIKLIAPGVLKNKLLELYREVDLLLDRAEGRETEHVEVEKLGRKALEELARRYLAEHPEA